MTSSTSPGHWRAVPFSGAFQRPSRRLPQVPRPEPEAAQPLVELDPHRLLLEVIGLLDGLARLVELARQQTATASQPVLENWLRTLEGLQRRFGSVLDKAGVQRIPTLGRHVNFSWHHVAEVQSDPVLPPLTIVAEQQAGYLWRGQVLRAARVVVTPAGQATPARVPNSTQE